MSRTELIRRVPLLEGLSPQELEPIAEVASERVVGEETNVVEIGDPGDSLFIILDGAVRVLYPARSQDFELARLGTGDFFGEMALLNEKPRSATVQTISETRLLVLEKSHFRQILRKCPDVAIHLLEELSLRIRNADEQISTLSDKAMQDTLTGLLNRRAFHERLQEETDRNRRYGDEFALILLDVDRFKSVNDTLGHDVGDEILSWIGRLLTEHTRAADAPFRVGGEEFAILAPATGGDIAGTVARRLVTVVSEARTPVDFDLNITLSGGYASCPEHATQPPRLFNLADQALLRAKAEGRNTICAPRPTGVG